SGPVRRRSGPRSDRVTRSAPRCTSGPGAPYALPRSLVRQLDQARSQSVRNSRSAIGVRSRSVTVRTGSRCGDRTRTERYGAMTPAVLSNNPRRMPWVPAIALLLATVAIVIAVIALTLAPTDSTGHAPSAPKPAVSAPAGRPTVHLRQPTGAVDCRAHRVNGA